MNENSTASLTLDEFPETSYAEWRAAAEESLKGAPFEKKLITRTHEGIELQPIYNRSDLEALVWPESWPGLPRFHRGAKPAPDRYDPWFFAQELPFGDPVAFNQTALADLQRGQNALSIVLDIATRRGVDADVAEPAAVAQCGLSVSLLADLERALQGVQIGAIPVLIWAGASPLPFLGAYAALAEKVGTDLQTLRGGVLGDPITEYVREGTLPLAASDAYEEIAEAIRWAISAGCPLRLVGVEAAQWADCGGTAVEELAFAIATGTESLRELVKRGIPAEQAAPRFAFELSLGCEIFMQIAKLRAARLLWAKITEAFGVKDTPMFLHGRGSLINKSVLDPYTNMLRATAEGFVGAIGGADSFHVAAFDEPIRTPDTFSRRIARNTHIILAEECGFSEPLDPAGGSWYVEWLTWQLANKAWELFQQVEAKGGMLAALREGMPQNAVAASLQKRRAAVASRRDGLIGVNLFPNPAEKPLDVPKLDITATYAARAEAVQAGRKSVHLGELRGVSAVMDAWKQGASLGSITANLVRTGAPEPEIARVRFVRLAEDYEALRANALAYADAHGGNLPKVWLATFGPPKQHKARADFSAGFLTPGGFLVESGRGAKTAEEAVEAAVAADPLAVVICSTDDTYPEIVPAFVPLLKQKLPGVRVILAGYPPEQIEAHKAAGVDDFIHIRLNCLEFNQQLQKALGIA